jgi:hypothetical protein
MSDEKTFVDSTGKRRVTISGSIAAGFTFVEEHFSDDTNELCWIPQTRGRSIPVCDSFETALREAIGRIPWLAESVATA